MAPHPPPHLTVVATSRNDDHGGDLRARMQLFVDGLAAQADRHRLVLELVLVEWNPPPDRAGLRDALRWPDPTGSFGARVVTVPSSLHARLDPAGALPLFQMIAKNVGIRRARAPFVLATNVDVLFPDRLVRTMRDELRAGVLYRADRLDVAPGPPEAPSFGARLEFCRRHVVRQHRADGTYVRRGGRWVNADAGLRPGALARLRRWAGRCWREALGPGPPLHRNGCGDFTLLDRETWFRLRGYPQWPVFSWHLDTVLLLQAAAHGVRFRNLPRAESVYHLDHGGGWTPEEQGRLFARLGERGVRVLTDADLAALEEELGAKGQRHERPTFNGHDWGLASEELPEAAVGGPGCGPRAGSAPPERL